MGTTYRVIAPCDFVTGGGYVFKDNGLMTNDASIRRRAGPVSHPPFNETQMCGDLSGPNAPTLDPQ